MRTWPLLLIALAAGWAQQPSETADVRVRGLVSDHQSGRPLPGAILTVSLPGKPPRTLTAGGDGRFTIEGLPPGDYRLSVQHGGYLSVRPALRVPPGEELTGVVIPMRRLAVISGRVVDHRGDPFPGAALQLMRRSQGADGAVFEETGPGGPNSLSTDDRGLFRIWALSPGEYLVCAQPSRNLAPYRILPAVRACYPDSSAPGEATPVGVDWGEVREGVDIRMGPGATTRLEATIGPTDLKLPQFLDIALSEEAVGGLAPAGQIAGPEGRLAIDGLPAGKYLLSAILRDRSLPAGWGQVSFSLVEGRTTTVDVQLTPPKTVQGRLVLIDPPEELLQTDGEPPEIAVTLDEPSDDALRLGRRTSVQRPLTELETRFELPALPGSYRVVAQMQPRQGYLAEVRLSGVAQPDNRIEIPADGAVGELVVVMRFDTGWLDAYVDLPADWRDRVTAAGGLLPEPILVEIYDSAGRSLQRAVDPGSGRAGPIELAPGRYQAVVARQELTRARSAEPPSDDLESFEIRPGQTTRVDLDVEPAR